MTISNKRKRRYKQHFKIRAGEGLYSQIQNSNKHVYNTSFTLKDFEEFCEQLSKHDYK